MGCGASKSGGGGTGEAPASGKDSSDPAQGAQKQTILQNIPEIKVVSGEAVKLTSQFPRVIFIFGIINYDYQIE